MKMTLLYFVVSIIFLMAAVARLYLDPLSGSALLLFVINGVCVSFNLQNIKDFLANKNPQ
jgi:hypothetical protein